MGTPAPTSVQVRGLTKDPAAIAFPNVTPGWGNGLVINNTIPAGTGDHLLAAEKIGRVGWMVKAPKSNGGSLWIGIGRAATAGRDIEVAPGEPFVMPAHLTTGDELRIRGTVGDKFFFMEG